MMFSWVLTMFSSTSPKKRKKKFLFLLPQLKITAYSFLDLCLPRTCPLCPLSLSPSLYGILKNASRNCQYQAQVVVRFQGIHLTPSTSGKEEKHNQNPEARWKMVPIHYYLVLFRLLSQHWSLLRASDTDWMVATKDRGKEEGWKGSNVCRPTSNRAPQWKYYIT